ncbi:MAG: ATP-dependent helicase RecQ [Thermomicrobiales bacterium]|nr:ATP-dependent helicase RecQ [Thermomicrobiales bacterium]
MEQKFYPLGALTMPVLAPTQHHPTQSRVLAPAGKPPASVDRRLRDLGDDSLAMLPAKLQWQLAAYYRAVGAFDVAARVLDAAERRGGESIRLLEERARLAFAMGSHGDARHLLEERARRAPSPTAQVALARFHLETGELEVAERLSEELSRANPDLVTVSTLAADVARAVGDFETARSYYLGAVDARPENAGALLSLARLAVDESDQEAAAAFLRRAVSAADEHVTAGQCLAAADIAAALGRAEQAEELRSRAASIEQVRTEALVAEVLAALPDAPPEPHSSESLISQSPPPPPASPRIEATALLADEPPAPAPAAVAWNAAEPTVELDPRVIETLRRDFGHHALRPGQAAVIAKVMADRDTLAIMPTGAGKSLTFQLPAMLRDGTTLVISPLIALMKDQVESLPTPVRERTALINSTLSPEELRARLADLREGRLKLVYVAPERLRDHAFLRALRAAGTSLVVIDEAHCISMWGHDFRPDYLFIPKALPELGDPTVLAITATATPTMATQVATGLRRDLERLRISVFRPNLHYEVHQLDNRERKVAKVIEICRREQGDGIVYVGSRKDADSIAALLRDNRVAAIPYHAGLAPDVRAQNQDRFMRGHVRVVVATVAFGMGVDKADVRFIVHLNPPASLEAYAQESGRAGRDGQPARCVLLASPTDESNLKRLARRDEIDLEALRRVYAMIKRSASGDWAIVGRDALLPSVSSDQEDEIDPRIALGILDQAGLVVRHPDAPASYDLRWRLSSADDVEPDLDDVDEAAWERVLRWLGPEARERASIIRTAEACAATGLTPVELDRLLVSRPELSVREGSRGVCLQLLPVTGSATSTLTTILDRAKSDAERRIRQVMAYVRGSRCRHVAIAAHLGEQLDPCGTSCDACAAATSQAGRRTAQASVEPSAARTTITAQDALAVLEGVRTLPFPMGKTGLAKLLTGSVESRVRADRSPAFGALAGLTRSKVEGLIDRLVAEGYLDRDLDHEFKLITLTQRGTEATLDDLASFAQSPKPSTSTHSAAKASMPSVEDGDLSEADQILLDRLSAWRREKASVEAVPPYVIAHNSMLRNLAVTRPTNTAMLASVPGFGTARVERYGAELLRLIASTRSS